MPTQVFEAGDFTAMQTMIGAQIPILLTVALSLFGVLVAIRYGKRILGLFGVR